VLVDRIGAQARYWATTKDVEVNVGSHLGADDRLAALVMERYREAGAGGALMNCDCCIYRAPLPGYERRVGAPVLAGSPVPPEGR
jgi:sirohydrochlorin cobaltochelatase